MPPADVEVSHEEPTSELARGLLARYYNELDARFPGGFDLDRTVAAPEARLVPPHGAFLVASLNGTPVGCGAVLKLEEAMAEIKRMWVDPAVRGRGVGGRLLAALEDVARDLGCSTAFLDTSDHLSEAVAMYLSRGYEEIPAYNANPYAAHWFRKRLD